jgi:hypothetical protein
VKLTNRCQRFYTQLRPNERFSLLLQAMACGDEGEKWSLLNNAGAVYWQGRDVLPNALAFDGLALEVFLQLLNLTSDYRELMHEVSRLAAAPAPENEGDKTLDTALAVAFLLNLQVRGWKLFCRRLGVTWHAWWSRLPGYERLRQAVAQARHCRHSDVSFNSWLAEAKGGGAVEEPLRPRDVARVLWGRYRRAVRRWGGTP